MMINTRVCRDILFFKAPSYAVHNTSGIRNKLVALSCPGIWHSLVVQPGPAVLRIHSQKGANMCCRYCLEKDLPELSDVFDIVARSALIEKFIDTHGQPFITHGEVRPTDIVPVIAPNSKGIRSAFPMQWGFLAPDNRRTLFNARVETANIKPVFKDAWKSRRCIVPASCYYEWQHFKGPDGRVKTGDKYAIQPAGCTVTWLCGLYRIEDGYPVFVILTREPSSELRRIHDRMPLILPKERIDAWIDPSSKPEDALQYALSDMIIEKVLECS